MEAMKMMLWLVVATYCCWISESRRNCPTLLRTVVNETVGSYPENGITGAIRGPNGHCVDIKGGVYSDGTEVILYPCYERLPKHQIWIYEESGSITSEDDYCLTASGNSRGTEIKVQACDDADAYDTHWEIVDGRVIKHRESGLVLSAISGKNMTTLTLETNVFSSFQTWSIGRANKPKLASIRSNDNQCLQVSNGAVTVGACKARKEADIWLTYPDGTIRPKNDEKGCLSYDNLHRKRVVILSCGLTPSSERWLFSGDKILNERANLAIEMKQPKEIIVNTPSRGNDNQVWTKIEL